MEGSASRYGCAISKDTRLDIPGSNFIQKETFQGNQHLEKPDVTLKQQKYEFQDLSNAE
jgi:hypothetical protein